jgi:hypothetical protein
VQRGRGAGIEEEEIDEAKWESQKGDEAQGTYRLLRAAESTGARMRGRLGWPIDYLSFFVIVIFCFRCHYKRTDLCTY